jgi:hypothetical protein
LRAVTVPREAARFSSEKGADMPTFRAVALIACLLGSAVLSSGCMTTTQGETFRYGFSDLQPNSAVGAQHPIPANLQLSAKSWKHEVRCNVFDTCETAFAGTMFVFDKRTGKELKWNRIEVFERDDCNASRDDRLKYKTVTDTDIVSLGWGDERKGKYEQVSALLVFYADWGSVTARVRTIACP